MRKRKSSGRFYRFFLIPGAGASPDPMLSRVRLIVIYAAGLVNILLAVPYTLFFLPTENTYVRLAFLTAVFLFIAAPLLFWLTRNLSIAQWVAAAGIITLAVEEIIDLNSFPGWGPLAVFAIIPLFYLIFEIRIGIFVPLFMATGTILRIKLSEFSPESLFNDPAYADSFIVVIIIAGVMSITTVVCIHLLFRHSNRLAFVDQVTGLPNRNKLQEDLEAQCRNPGWANRHFSLIGIEIFNFINLNANIGTSNSDLVLREAAGRLTAFERFSVGRWSGSVFLVRVGTSQLDLVEAYCREIMKSLREEYMIENGSVNVQFVLAVARYPVDGESAGKLTENIAALLDRKSRVPGEIVFHNEQEVRREHYRFKLNESLNRAGSRKEFSIVYQPRISLSDGCSRSAEALLRWSNAELGSIPPSEFIPVAEEAGLIRRLTQWVVALVFKDSVEMLTSGGLPAKYCFAVNISIMDLKSVDFIPYIARKLEETGCDPFTIEFEVTESVQADLDPQIMKNLQNLKSMGFRIAIDDFGTGYSSLSYLTRMDVHNLKIDKSFIDGITGAGGPGYPVIDAIISMGKSLGIEITAEGVETDEQLDYLKKRGCDAVQGWYFAKAMPLTDLCGFIAKPKL